MTFAERMTPLGALTSGNTGIFGLASPSHTMDDEGCGLTKGL